ncbi:PadR family transcriptional regulator [Cryobacterium fucosi]|uniref:PadR family transcriptional regulator n=1 Tax=Cryobacterium fucosi TaxID=1259157 RepID=UPI00141AD488|nr:PadR family transcriptional regulator [Cryobacterium fucosi]
MILAWSGDQSQIYRTLALLVAEGLAEVEVIAQDGRPDRRVHRITPTGLTALREWPASPLPPETPHDAFLVRVFFVGEPVDLAHALRRATLRNGIRHAEAELAWLGETVEALS